MNSPMIEIRKKKSPKTPVPEVAAENRVEPLDFQDLDESMAEIDASIDSTGRMFCLFCFSCF